MANYRSNEHCFAFLGAKRSCPNRNLRLHVGASTYLNWLLRHFTATRKGGVLPVKRETDPNKRQNGSFVTMREAHYEQPASSVSPFILCWTKRIFPGYDFMICGTRQQHSCSLSVSIRKLSRNCSGIVRSLSHWIAIRIFCRPYRKRP
mgnify:CR=1 FL=1